MAEKTSGWRRIAKALVVAGVMSAGVAPAQRDGLQIRAFGVGAKNATLGVAQTPGCEGETAFEVYRSVQVGGPWQFVTNDLLRPEEPARSYDLVRGPLKASEFFAVHLFVDFDGDGLSDMYERLETKTDPEVADTDGDGLSDGEEVALGTNPLTDDTDGDGIRDAEETGYGTDPTLCDTDGDGLDDYRELKEFGTNPCDASEDSDADGLSDAWELLYGYDRYMWNDASADGDSDGLTDGEECRYGTNPASEDTDGDGFGDRWEAMYCARLNPERAAEAGWSNIFDPVGREDTETFHEYDDGDGLTAYEECECGTNPFAADTDGDGLPDGWEVWSGLDPLDAEGDNGADGDPDGDWLTNAQEYELQTESLWQDSDNDGLPDGMEVMMYWTNPRNSDTDGDGLNDGDEALVHGTDPSVTDTDGDGLDDYEEVMIYSSDPNSRDSDADGDGMPDGWETENGTDPRNCDGTYDSDKDGLDNGTEYAIGTNPREPDTDGDTMHDGWEAKYWENTSGSGGEQEPSAKSMTLLERFTKFIPFVNNEDDDDPDNDANSDPDEDGMTNFYECQFGTNPHLADTDGDGVSDGDEVMQNSNPRDASDRGEKNSRVRVMILFGDHSASHSEKYMLHVAPADENDNLYDAENYNILNHCHPIRQCA